MQTLDSLKNKNEFDLVFKCGTRFATPYAKMYFLSLNNDNFCNNKKNYCIFTAIKKRNARVYLGLSVGKKIGNSPTRNLYKRRARHIFMLDDFAGFAIVFLPHPSIAQLSFKDLSILCFKALNYVKKVQKKATAKKDFSNL